MADCFECSHVRMSRKKRYSDIEYRCSFELPPWVARAIPELESFDTEVSPYDSCSFFERATDYE
jgi:hypothetical protein